MAKAPPKKAAPKKPSPAALQRAAAAPSKPLPPGHPATAMHKAAAAHPHPAAAAPTDPAAPAAQTPKEAKAAAKAATHAGKETQATADLKQLGVPDNILQSVKNPKKFLHQLKSGKGPAWKKLRLLQAASAPYEAKAEDPLTKELTDALAAGAPANLFQPDPGMDPATATAQQAMEDPMIGQMQNYVTERLGVGLTPDEQSSIRGDLRAPVEQTYQQQNAAAGQAAAGSGIDPGSGVGRARAAQLEQTRQQGLSGVENTITDLDLQRKQQIEQEAQGLTSQEEAARQGDINAQLRRTAQVEGGVAGIAGLDESQREFDVTETEAQRQAWMARQAWQKFGASLKPSTLEQVAGGIGGFLGGVSGGG